MPTTAANTDPRRLRPLPGAEGGLRLAVCARAQRDVGVVIAAPGGEGLIAGVAITEGKLWPDDRGFFTELFRLPGGAGVTQVSAALSYPQVVKGVHYHRVQTDCWAPVRGEFQLALFDLRCDSPTFGAVNTLFAGEWRPWRIRIPPGVGHGYKVLGSEPGLMVYATDRYYDPEDEGRIAFDDSGLNYAWETQYR
ncbi:MAG: dTDP-4-dehydrorhamnose 3,5-epimerase [Acidobacteria bacterium]|nr:MAG: dTDP-4-dehydrorhamnose 3,5-epimerase [Acidobacteriota bacterium]